MFWLAVLYLKISAPYKELELWSHSGSVGGTRVGLLVLYLFLFFMHAARAGSAAEGRSIQNCWRVWGGCRVGVVSIEGYSKNIQQGVEFALKRF